LDFGNLIANASAQSFGLAFSIFGGNATNAPVMQVTTGAAGSQALSVLRLNGSGGTPIVSSGSIIDTTGTPTITYGMDLNGATVSGAGLRAGYGATAVSSRNQAAGADIGLLNLATVAGTTNLLQFAAPAGVTTGTMPVNAVITGLTSIYNSVNGTLLTQFMTQNTDSAATTFGIANAGNVSTFRTYRADGTSAALSAVTSGEVLGAFQSAAYDGTTWGVATNFRAVAAETWTNVPAHGTYMSLFTTATGTNSLGEVLRFQANGGIQLNTLAAVPVAADFISAAKNSVLIYARNGKIVFVTDNAGTLEYLSIAVDGSTTAWSAQAGGSAP
jgi:hypothetical protein